MLAPPTSGDGWKVRRARVVSLLEPHFQVGVQFTVVDVYVDWNTVELLAVKRLHSHASVERTVAALRAYTCTP